jgi:hypothetical protein
MMPRSEERGCHGEGREDAEERGERMPRGGATGVSACSQRHQLFALGPVL